MPWGLAGRIMNLVQLAAHDPHTVLRCFKAFSGGSAPHIAMKSWQFGVIGHDRKSAHHWVLRVPRYSQLINNLGMSHAEKRMCVPVLWGIIVLGHGTSTSGFTFEFVK